jgi:geranylgeranyl diphosphate synthase type II
MFVFSDLQKQINEYIAHLQVARTPEGLYLPIEYILSLGGKRLRPVLMLMAYNLYKEDVSPIYAQAAGIEVFHNYTLLHDDLMDRADLRRGKMTVHKKWSDNTAILSGDAMLVISYRLMGQCSPAHLGQVMNLFSETALEVCEGQQYDMEFETEERVSIDSYLEMIRLKTAVLLAASLKMGAILADAPKEDAQALYDFGINMGMAFQLKDDLLDVYGDAARFGKKLGGDILCNKKTYLLIKAMEHADSEQRERLLTLMTVPTLSPEEKIAGVTALYNEIGVGEHCKQAIKAYSRLAESSLAKVKVPDAAKQEAKLIIESLINREV